MSLSKSPVAIQRICSIVAATSSLNSSALGNPPLTRQSLSRVPRSVQQVRGDLVRSPGCARGWSACAERSVPHSSLRLSMGLACAQPRQFSPSGSALRWAKRRGACPCRAGCSSQRRPPILRRPSSSIEVHRRSAIGQRLNDVHGRVVVQMFGCKYAPTIVRQQHEKRAVRA